MYKTETEKYFEIMNGFIVHEKKRKNSLIMNHKWTFHWYLVYLYKHSALFENYTKGIGTKKKYMLNAILMFAFANKA